MGFSSQFTDHSLQQRGGGTDIVGLIRREC